MFSPSNGEHDHHNLRTTHNSISTSPSLSTKTASSSSSSNSSFTAPKTVMEDVWKDLNLQSFPLQQHHNHQPPNPFGGTGSAFQDFLARPFSPNRYTAPPTVHSPSPPPQRTLLSLNSSPDQLSFLEPAHIPNGGHFGHPFDQLLSNSTNSSSNLLANNNNVLSMYNESEKKPGDRRHKRMIKNRESAARSRARKQAYTNELENEVAQLKKEIARLQVQQRELVVAAASQHPKRKSLNRASSAPF